MERRRKQTKPNSDFNPDLIFPLLLSSLLSTTASANHPNNQKKIKISSNNDNYSQINLQLQLLNHLHASLASPDSEFSLPGPIIALIPALLTSKYAKVVCKCAKFVGAASLHSWEMNQQIANDEEIMRSLISGLACWKIRKILLAMCNAVLDMATTSLGRQCLIDGSALNCIMWEGFAHIALYSWFQDLYQGFNSSHDLDVISVNLLHVAIKQIGDRDPKFRKACLVGAVSLSSDGQNRVYQNQKIIFSHLIKTIYSESSFSDAFDNVTLSLGKNEDPFRKLRWLQKLSEVEIFDLQKWMICNELREKAEASFVSVKSKFCNEVIFEDGGMCYHRLLQKYRKVRENYTNGMLSLHCY